RSPAGGASADGGMARARGRAGGRGRAAGGRAWRRTLRDEGESCGLQVALIDPDQQHSPVFAEHLVGLLEILQQRTRKRLVEPPLPEPFHYLLLAPDALIRVVDERFGLLQSFMEEAETVLLVDHHQAQFVDLYRILFLVELSHQPQEVLVADDAARV